MSLCSINSEGTFFASTTMLVPNTFAKPIDVAVVDASWQLKINVVYNELVG